MQANLIKPLLDVNIYIGNKSNTCKNITTFANIRMNHLQIPNSLFVKLKPMNRGATYLTITQIQKYICTYCILIYVLIYSHCYNEYYKSFTTVNCVPNNLKHT